MGFSGINWIGKASRFTHITSSFPQWDGFGLWAGGFNANEWSGAAVWVFPTLLFATLSSALPRSVRFAIGMLSVGLGFLLVLAQSLSALLGAGGAIVLGMALLGRQTPKVSRTLMLLAGVALLIGNMAILVAPRQSADLLAEFSGRPNITSLEHRAVIWQRAQSMLSDHPLTGVGIAMYRQLRDVYPTPGFEHALLPHPHNEALQFATDLGIPGLLIYAWFAITAGQCALHVIRHGTSAERALAIALVTGLFGHAIYALTDAIPIWDRFAFMGWWWLGLLSGLERRVSGRQGAAPVPDTPPSA